jgi:hypothetical protein
MHLHPRRRLQVQGSLEFFDLLENVDKKFPEAEYYSRRLEAFGLATACLGTLVHNSKPRAILELPTNPGLPMTPYQSAVWKAICQTQKSKALTYAEVIDIVTERMATEAQYLLRLERHPKNPDKKSQEA